ncbi:MAG: Rha family transcriptional regulator [Bacteroidaceae bacterium]|nr:Rha family transcriptional regulator [Bacteroidaceae bacterium]
MKTIVLNTQNVGNDIQHMTSLEVAELTGKQHKHVMEAIRKMEPAWTKICGSNFRLTSLACSSRHRTATRTYCILMMRYSIGKRLMAKG